MTFPKFFAACMLVLVFRVNAGASDSDVVSLFAQLSGATKWRLVRSISLDFDAFHPQGMVIVGDAIFFSSVEVTKKTVLYKDPAEGFDRSPGDGIGHLFKVGFDGSPRADQRLAEGRMYHPGGIDFDGRFIWMSLAEYRPNSASVIYRIDPADMRPLEVLRIRDHVGAVVYNPLDSTLYALNWGARKFYRWKLDGGFQPGAVFQEGQTETRVNRSHYIDYQDCHFLPDHFMLCGGLKQYPVLELGRFALGGLELVDLRTLRPTYQVPVPVRLRPDLVMTNNPFYFKIENGRLRFYFMPENGFSTIYVFEPR